MLQEGREVNSKRIPQKNWKRLPPRHRKIVCTEESGGNCYFRNKLKRSICLLKLCATVTQTKIKITCKNVDEEIERIFLDG